MAPNANLETSRPLFSRARKARSPSLKKFSQENVVGVDFALACSTFQ
jgi:hypothetical protein